MTATDSQEVVVIAEVVTEETLEAQVAAMRIEVARMSEIVANQVTLLGAIKDTLEPMLDKLAANPMFRMMFPDDKGGK